MNTDHTAHTKSRYNWIAPFYNLMEWPVEQLWYKKWREELWANVRGPELLEVGVGTGKNISYYPSDIQVTAIDLTPNMLQFARQVCKDQEYENISLKEMDVQDLDFEDNRFDEVVSTFVFCSVPDPIKGLEEIMRVTKPGGKLFLLEHMTSRNRFLASIMETIDPLIHYVIGVHIARHTVKNLKKAGWKINSERPLSSTGIYRYIEAAKPLAH